MILATPYNQITDEIFFRLTGNLNGFFVFEIALAFHP